MTKDVLWTKQKVDEFMREAMLTDEEEKIFLGYVYGMSITQQSMQHNMSESKVSRIIKKLREKYDEVEQYSIVLTPRKKLSLKK